MSSRKRSRRLDARITPLLQAHAPELLGIYGVGIDTAATLLVTAGDNPERLRSEAAWAHLCGVSPLEASSGKVTRHRLNRGGDRQANRALWTIVITRLASDPETQAYMERRVKEGRSKREVVRILKRYVAREVYRYLASRLTPRTMDLAHLTPVVRPGLTFNRFAGPWFGFTEFSKTRDLIRACPLHRVAHHWSVRCLPFRKTLKKVLTSTIGASGEGQLSTVADRQELGHAYPSDFQTPWRSRIPASRFPWPGRRTAEEHFLSTTAARRLASLPTAAIGGTSMAGLGLLSSGFARRFVVVLAGITVIAGLLVHAEHGVSQGGEADDHSSRCLAVVCHQQQRDGDRLGHGD